MENVLDTAIKEFESCDFTCKDSKVFKRKFKICEDTELQETLVKKICQGHFIVVGIDYSPDTCWICLTDDRYKVIKTYYGIPNCCVSQKRWYQMEEDICGFVYDCVEILKDKLDNVESPRTKRLKTELES